MGIVRAPNRSGCAHRENSSSRNRHAFDIDHDPGLNPVNGICAPKLRGRCARITDVVTMREESTAPFSESLSFRVTLENFSKPEISSGQTPALARLSGNNGLKRRTSAGVLLSPRFNTRHSVGISETPMHVAHCSANHASNVEVHPACATIWQRTGQNRCALKFQPHVPIKIQTGRAQSTRRNNRPRQTNTCGAWQ